jgi:hypothetical protein
VRGIAFLNLPIRIPPAKSNQTARVGPNGYFQYQDGAGWEIVYSEALYASLARPFLGLVAKFTEARMRELYGFKKKLAIDVNKVIGSLEKKRSYGMKVIEMLASEPCRQAINEAVEGCMARDIASRQPVRLDTEKLEDIRAMALETQERLAALGREDEKGSLQDSSPHKKSAIPETPLPGKGKASVEPALKGLGSSGDPWRDLASLLTPAQRQALIAVLAGDNLRAVADEAGILAEILVDGINEAGLQTLNDSLLEYDGEAATIYGPYREGMQKALSAWEGTRQ